MQTNQSGAHTLNHILYLTFTLQNAKVFCPKYPRAQYQTTRDHTYSPELTKTTIKPFAPAFPSPPLSVVANLSGMLYPLLLETERGISMAIIS